MKVFSLSMTATYHKVFEITAKNEGQPTDFSDVDPLYGVEVIG